MILPLFHVIRISMNSSSLSSLFRCIPLPPEHPCLSVPDRGSNFTLPQLLTFDRAINISNIYDTFQIYASLKGSYPDVCLDVAKHFFCILIAPPCDPTSNGLPMHFCEQDCVALTRLKEGRTCKDLLNLFRRISGSVGNPNVNLTVTAFVEFDCKSYYPFKFNNYAETCTRLLSQHYKGIDVGIEAKLSI